jgi:diguanylate cyclase (GGDEF)-like protein
MRDVALDCSDPRVLLDEIASLRARVEGLEAKCVELDQLAHCDPLVPLVNRRGLYRELETIIARHDRHGTPAAMLFIDLDGLKVINDCFGHEAGDAALIHVAEQLLSGVRTNDCVARIGGDEFCVLLDHADEASAIETAERLVNLVAGDDFLFDGKPMPLSVAIGLTLVERGDSPGAILARADQAMYRVKVAA